MTKKLYLEDTYQFHFEGLIQEAGKDEKGIFIILDQTTFYPQGGGQPSDHGIIKNDHFEANVIKVTQFNNEIKHYITSTTNEVPVGSKVYCLVNQERRLINARYHTAGHLLGNVIEILYPKLKAIKGHSFPGEAYVEFQGDEAINATTLQNEINEAIAKNDKTKVFEIDPESFEQHFYKLSYNIPENKKFRAMQIGDMLPVPCGGTHLSSVGEIRHVNISRIKAKNNCLRIAYEVT
ncbi:alanyl-tRNA editing protein [Candidatus Trichorickettsia mobilis]|uniref:alanyl-tRNA editing protein n=1 Tax=Candidatus Trichorickettsia mobilis TaxID=1346319 RepID=UPI00292E598E|nr:alanyl-tRNA editing protein [Candidatus Trichorickettsia mobilis]